ncbi:MAG: hypothetical protein MZV63_16050 [Marinilabiliales bacterium]|nr:hypothetical protein [Marinilabiliales bacterium]
MLKNADRIITVGESLKKLFASKETSAEEKTTVIHNGFDEEDFKGIKTADPSRFTLTYVGTLADNYPLARAA